MHNFRAKLQFSFAEEMKNPTVGPVVIDLVLFSNDGQGKF